MEPSENFGFELFKHYQPAIPNISISPDKWAKNYVQSQINNLMLSLEASLEVYQQIPVSLYNYVQDSLDSASDCGIYLSGGSVNALKDRAFILFEKRLK